jgi:hypothetical protein
MSKTCAASNAYAFMQRIGGYRGAIANLSKIYSSTEGRLKRSLGEFFGLTNFDGFSLCKIESEAVP